MQRHDVVSASTLTWDADVAYNTTNPSTRSEYASTLRPHFIQLRQEAFVISNVTELLRITLVVLLQRPIRGRGNDEVYRIVGNPRQVPSIALLNHVRGAIERSWPRDRTEMGISFVQGAKG